MASSLSLCTLVLAICLDLHPVTAVATSGQGPSHDDDANVDQQSQQPQELFQIPSTSAVDLPSDLSPSAASLCARGCRCTQNLTIANCSYANLDVVPTFPASTRVLVLDWNRIEVLNSSLLRLDNRTGNGSGRGSRDPVSRDPTETDRNVTSTTSPLEAVSFAHNNISIVSASTFRGLSALRQLRLNDNNIRQLPVDLFADNADLGLLSLAENPALDGPEIGRVLAGGRGPALPVLRLLDLSGTRLVGADGRLPEVVFGQLPALEHLVMRRLNVDNISGDFFSSLTGTGLRKLDLGKSSLRSVDESAFVSLADRLRELVLDDVIVSTRQLENVFAGLAAGGNVSAAADSNSTDSISQLEMLSLRNVFVIDAHDSMIDHHLFRHLVNTRLKTLHMDGNYVGFGQHRGGGGGNGGGKVPERLFHPLRHLVTLTLNSCNIRSISTDTFKGLHHLQTLSLRHNLLSCVRQSDCGFMTSPQAPRMLRLRVLDLADNLLTTGNGNDDVGNDDDNSDLSIRFDESVFPDLISLDLSRNRITTISSGTFGRLQHLARLLLNDNPIHNIDLGAFSGLPGLTRLELDACRRLTHLRLGALSGLGRLRVLSIQDSGLVHLQHSVLLHLDHLEELYLRNNRLGQQGASIEKVSASHTNRLKTVDLGSNRLPTIPLELLSRQPSLRAVYLDDNRLSNCSQLDVMFRSSTDQLETVDVSGNVFTELDVNCFRHLPGRVQLHLADNPLDCSSCSTADALRSLTAATVGGVDGEVRRGQPTVVDWQSVTCDSGGSDGAAVNPFQFSSAVGAGIRLQVSSSLPPPTSLRCRYSESTIWATFAVLVAVVIVLAVSLLLLLTLSVFCRHRQLQRRRRSAAVANSTCSVGDVTSNAAGCCCVGGSGGCSSSPRASAAVASGSGSSVTISNSCYSSSDRTPMVTVGGSATSGAGPLGDYGVHYSPLVEDEEVDEEGGSGATAPRREEDGSRRAVSGGGQRRNFPTKTAAASAAGKPGIASDGGRGQQRHLATTTGDGRVANGVRKSSHHLTTSVGYDGSGNVDHQAALLDYCAVTDVEDSL